MNNREIKVIPLRCKQCGLALEGLSYDVVFFCPHCQDAWELIEDSLEKRKAYAAQPPSPGALSVLYLPFWVFEIDKLRFETDNVNKEKRLENCAMKFKLVYVEAYTVFLGSLYGHLAPMYTLRQVATKRLPAKKLLACTQPSATLIPFVKDHLLAAVDKSVDVSGVEAQFDIIDFYLLNMPYIQVNSELLDLYTEMKIGIRGIAEFSLLKQIYV